jgi:hypothetical protein
MKIEDLLGKEVQIFPGDTYYKYGIIEDMTPQGILFRITKSDLPNAYPVGSYQFISYSANLTYAFIGEK